MKMAETHLDADFVESNLTEENIKEIYSEHYTKPLDQFNFMEAMNVIWLNIQTWDEYIADTESFKLIKTDQEKGKNSIAFMREGLFAIAKRLIPVMPETAKIILEAIKVNKKPDNLFNRLEG
jgi:methionyl-tRNA synthetase